MAAPFHIRVGDRGPVLFRALQRADGSPEPLPDGTTVVLRVFDALARPTDYASEVVDGDAGTVRYLWADGEPTAAELEEPAQFRYVFVVTLPDGRVVTSPTIGADILIVHPRARST